MHRVYQGLLVLQVWLPLVQLVPEVQLVPQAFRVLQDHQAPLVKEVFLVLLQTLVLWDLWAPLVPEGPQEPQEQPVQSQVPQGQMALLVSQGQPAPFQDHQVLQVYLEHKVIMDPQAQAVIPESVALAV